MAITKRYFLLISFTFIGLGIFIPELTAAESPFDAIDEKAEEGLEWVLTKLTSFIGTIYLVIKFISVMNGRSTWDELLKALFIIVGISSAAVIVDWLIITVSN